MDPVSDADVLRAMPTPGARRRAVVRVNGAEVTWETVDGSHWPDADGPEVLSHLPNWVCRQPPPVGAENYPAALWVALDAAVGEGAAVAWERWIEAGRVLRRVTVRWGRPRPHVLDLAGFRRLDAKAAPLSFVWPACHGSRVEAHTARQEAARVAHVTMRCNGCGADAAVAVATDGLSWPGASLVDETASLRDTLRAKGCCGAVPDLVVGPDLADGALGPVARLVRRVFAEIGPIGRSDPR